MLDISLVFVKSKEIHSTEIDIGLPYLISFLAVLLLLLSLKHKKDKEESSLSENIEALEMVSH